MRRTSATDRKTADHKPKTISKRFKMTALTVSAAMLVPATGAGAQITSIPDNFATLANAVRAGNNNQETIIRVKAPNCVNITESELARVPTIKPVFDRIAAQPLTGAP